MVPSADIRAMGSVKKSELFSSSLIGITFEAHRDVVDAIIDRGIGRTPDASSLDHCEPGAASTDPAEYISRRNRPPAFLVLLSLGPRELLLCITQRGVTAAP